MTSKLHCVVTETARLSGGERDAMFTLFSSCYDCVTRASFEADLAEKTNVILLLDELETIRGFSTQQVFDWTFQGEPVRILFSGDTIVEPACWGSAELAKGWCAVAAAALEAVPKKRLFWFLISKGYRTYLYLPLFFRRFIPSLENNAPEEWQALLDQVAAWKFGQAWNPAAGVIQFEESRGQLSGNLAEISAARLADPNVQYFLERNPHYARGAELACLAEVSLENTHGLGTRWLTRSISNLPA